MPVAIVPPAATPVPLVVDSPHSGTHYPADFRFACAPELLRSAEDAYVHDLLGAAPDVGGTLVHALFPRTYVDPNRDEGDVDPEMLDGPWPHRLNPGEKTALGLGLVWRLAAPGVPVYDRKLGVGEVEARIRACYRPYHQALARAIDGAHDRFGRVYYIDGHSMKSAGNGMSPDPGCDRPDFCVSDLRGRTSDPAFVKLVAEVLGRNGLRVAINDPYLGAELIRRHGRPQEGRHAVQVEIKRSLYMDEATRRPNAGYAPLKALLSEMLAVAAAFAAGGLR
ncbi:MAG: N-formylglutamate amidohydrolase [Alphaproteobacteria bacterium]|nr:N-formylglutamate amidohydrolase [Alphaproteobacteria bacterium]